MAAGAGAGARGRGDSSVTLVKGEKGQKGEPAVIEPVSWFFFVFQIF